MTNPHQPGTPEWQQWLNEQVEAHDDDPETVARDTQQELERHRNVRGQVNKKNDKK